MTDEICSYGDGEPVHASGKCARCYQRDYKRLTEGKGLEVGRRPLDDTVYKLRYRLPDGGGSNTKHYSDPKVAERWAARHREAGTLLFYARYTLSEKFTSTLTQPKEYP